MPTALASPSLEEAMLSGSRDALRVPPAAPTPAAKPHWLACCGLAAAAATVLTSTATLAST
eukprot:7824484-Pyramimonas_sp.AAC.1